MPTIAEYLKYANLQMAAESLFGFNAYKDAATLTPGATSNLPLDTFQLQQGNLHASRFTATEATKFAEQWTVVQHISNTTTGFSGTLFQALKDDPLQNIKAGDLVLSFRSTESIDDAARDNAATNVLEIKDKGFAFGQLADMEAWYADLSKAGGPLEGKQITLTGYSLAGHLTTAFNLMHPGVAQQVINFNGAGLGRFKEDPSLDYMKLTLPKMISAFRILRDEGGTPDGLAPELQSQWGKDTYAAIRAELKKDPYKGSVPAAPAALIDIINQRLIGTDLDGYANNDRGLLLKAIKAAAQVADKAHRVGGLFSGAPADSDVPPNPAAIPDAAIAGESFDYQLAVYLTQQRYNTQPLDIPSGGNAALGVPVWANGSGPSLANQWDVAGWETASEFGPWYMVAYSQYRYGQMQNVFIEDQPFTRGDAINQFVSHLLKGEVELLYPQYYSNDFGDTHSLVLIVDSLSVQNTLAQLLPAGVRDSSLKPGMPFPESRRWRYAESLTTPANDSTWRLAA